jgi:cyclomaltodextrinase / maltogenic alpha-amylase / neopullulanase
MNALSLPKILGTIRPKPFLLPFAIFTFAAIRLDSARAQETASQNAVSSAETVQHQFVYHSSTKRNSVAVAGTFNNWDKTANPLVSDASGTTWRTSLRLAKGKHLYKFVLDGETWITDPGQAGKENDGNGNINSVLFLTPSDYRRPASPVDGITAQSALLHLTSLPYLNADGGWLSLSLRARPNDLKRVSLKVGSRRYPMTIEARDEIYARYFTRIAWDRTQDLAYTFELVDGDTTRALGVNGLDSTSKAKPFRLKAKEFKPFVVPTWVEQSVLYQIFPDRFANGDKTNDPPDVQPWETKPTGFSRLGGDVQGVRQHLPYLAELGISAVYFTPVFQSPSNHRYDAEDYTMIDPQFGTNAEFAALTRELQSKGIRTVMDFVFNHTAVTFRPFLDIRQQGEASAYKDWYFIKSYPVRVQDNPNYVAWWNYPSMPKLNLLNPKTADYMLNLVNFWKKEVPLMGLRLDVADQVDIRFWRTLRKRVKGLDPQMWIVGEVWSNASSWLTGDQWDAAMNYPFLFANADFFAEGKTSASQFLRRLMEIYHWYPPQVSRNMMNLLSSHDRPRFLTLCKNDARLHQLAAAVQFTWVGTPSIYYGEELGMEGGADPDNRRGMRWDLATADNAMLQYYKRLIRLRNSSPALQSGTPEILLTDDKAGTLAYSRLLGDQIAIVAVNRSEKAQNLVIPLPENRGVQAARRTGFVDGLSDRRISLGKARSLRLTLEPMQAAVLLPAGRTVSHSENGKGG